MKKSLPAIWWFCFVIFALHQLTQKILDWKIPWADNYLDSLLCIPIFLGLLLVERRFFFGKVFSNKKNNNTYTFSLFETFIITLVLAIIFEEGFPRWSSHFTKDLWDYFNYFVGGLFFYYFINKKKSY